MKPDLEAIRERCDAATEGPWAMFGEGHTRGVCRDGRGTAIFDSRMGATVDDARFIAAARTDILALLAYVDELEDSK